MTDITWTGTAGNDSKAGGGGDDMLDGGGGHDTLTGGAGADTLYGGDGDDTVGGGADGDRLFGGRGDDTLSGGGGADTIYGQEGADTLEGGDGNDTLYAGDGDDTLDGGSGNDALSGEDGDDRLTGGAGNDRMWGGRGNDTFVFAAGAGSDIIADFSAGDTIEISGVSGGFGALRIEQDGADTVIRYGDADTITLQNVTASSLDSNAFRFTASENTQGQNTPSENTRGQSNGDGNGGSDPSSDPDEGSGGAPQQGAPAQSAGGKVLTGGNGGQKLNGGKGSDTLTGGAGDDTLRGRKGDDTLEGGKGDDRLYGGRGNDTLAGHQGDDTLTGGRGADTFVFTVGDGDDTITDFGDGDRIRLSHADAFGVTVGQDGDDALIRYGDRGDTITLSGVSADSVDLERDVIVPYVTGINSKKGGAGNDGIYGSVVYTGTGASGTVDDILKGRGGDDILSGYEGDDTLFGGKGDDMLRGGRGNDTLTGGAGADTFVFRLGDGADTITDFGAGDRIRLNDVSGGFSALRIEQDGADAVIRYYAPYGSDTITLSGVSAESLTEEDFIIQPRTGKDVHEYIDISGGQGDDTLTGGHLNDRMKGWGGDDTLYGRAGDDRLYGSIGDDTLHGGDGADYFLGGQGNDTLAGGKGADTFTFRPNFDGADTITDFGAGDRIEVRFFDAGFSGLQIDQYGADAVISFPGKPVGATITLSGVSAASLTENDFIFAPPVNYAGRNYYNHGDGHDILYGDNDRPADGYRFSIHHEVPDDDVDYMYGRGGDDFLFGGRGDDWLYGGTGKDTLDGGKGNDTLMGGRGADRFVFDRKSETDHIRDFEDGEDLLVIKGGLKFSDLAIRQKGEDTIINGPSESFSIVLEGIEASQLTETDFAFLG